MDSIWMQILAFALPGGFLGSVFTWIFSRRKQNNDFLKELQSSINLLSGENKKILEENIQLRRENIDLKANQEEMLVRIDRLTKEVERLRKTIGKRNSYEDKTLFAAIHPAAGKLHCDEEAPLDRDTEQTDTVSHMQRGAQNAVEQTARAAMNSRSEETSVLRALRTEAIPLRTAAVTVTEESLRNLPEGAAYVARDGRLTLEARRDGDTIRISARSDSLARRVEYYKATSARQDRYADSLKESLAETREAYDRLLEVSRHQSSETAIQQTRSPAYRGRWMLFGIVIGCLGGWWAHKTNLFAKLFKTI